MNSSNRSPARREELLRAAVLVFARKGYHTCRVSDIADEAGVSHGLVYHYFASKDEVLETIFRENWAPIVAAIEGIAETDGPSIEKLRKIATLVLNAWRRDEDSVRVLVREIARSPQLQERIGEFQHAFDALERIIVRGQESGEFDAGLHPRFATYAVWGTLDEILTGWVLGRLPSGPEDVDRAEATVAAMLGRALAG
ncbi:MAG: TetR/AcrR family transcriptional regulator, fatty acid metabolism regulator protein [Gaiellaceae bacterium]|jgi:AcrR family transcriptional regulator|nr:TetR/AcrR family transcriptional regulator, fatty acid metabolism regulator protein [Gaiellaceae bacterium]